MTLVVASGADRYSIRHRRGVPKRLSAPCLAMRLIDEQFLETPWYGSRQMARHLRRNGWCVGRHRVRRLMSKMGLAPIYQRPKTSEPHPQHRTWPYLLRHQTVGRPNQVWCADVTYIPMRRGFLYLVAIMDWFSRKVLAWRLSNTMDADFCVTALEEAIAHFGKPEIFNTDQGSQFTCFAFTNTLKDADIRISMDGRGLQWMFQRPTKLMITAELPGLDEKNMEVKLSNGVLSIKGEKQEEKEEKEKEKD